MKSTDLLTNFDFIMHFSLFLTDVHCEHCYSKDPF